MFVIIEFGEHLIRVDSDYDKGLLGLTLFKGRVGGHTKMIDQTKLTEYDQHTLMSRLLSNKDARDKRKKDEAKPV